MNWFCFFVDRAPIAVNLSLSVDKRVSPTFFVVRLAGGVITLGGFYIREQIKEWGSYRSGIEKKRVSLSIQIDRLAE